MSGQYQERRELDAEFKRFTEILISQNEAVNRIYLAQSASTEKALESVASQMANLASSQTKLMDTQATLLSSHIEHKKDLEYINKRAERQDDTLSKSIAKIEKVSNTLILIEERTDQSNKKWAYVGGIIVAIITSGLIGYLNK
jgi:septal ring factor EnvC (AmiA/AmiB activator)